MVTSWGRGLNGGGGQNSESISQGQTEWQNEQLANCLSFDEETFNYPLGRKGPLLSKANLSLLATSLPQRPVCLRLPLLLFLLLTSPLPPWVSASPRSKDNHNPELGPDSILFVKCSPKIWALGKRWKDECCLPLKERIKQVNFLWLCPVLEFVFPQSTKATIGLDRRLTLSQLPCLCPHLIHRIIDGNACLLSTTPF